MNQQQQKLTGFKSAKELLNKGKNTDNNVQIESKQSSTSTIQVNPNQKGNPLLQFIRSRPWTWAETDINKVSDTFPDYLVGKGSAALFLSLKYHKVHPEYVYNRLKFISGYKLLILLCLVDIPDHNDILKELHQLSLNSNLTLFLSWSPEEAAKYLENFKINENKAPDSIQTKVSVDNFTDTYLASMNESLTKIRHINKNDVLTLTTNFGNFKNLANATKQQISLCPGLGDKKVVELGKVFNQPFKPKNDDNNYL